MSSIGDDFFTDLIGLVLFGTEAKPPPPILP